MNTDWKNKRVGVLGAGVEGISSANFLVEQGAEVILLDAKEMLDEGILNQVQDDMNQGNIVFHGGEDYLQNLTQFDVLFRSPGIKPSLPELVDAAKQGITITSQTNLFFALSPAPIIGVTGTKGKGTTASLIYEMIKTEGLPVYLGGNIGVPPLTFLEDLTPSSWVVLELSSFQLMDLQRSPHIAVMLMITNEHQDYHTDITEYIDAKRNLIRFQTPTDFAILNRDYPATHESDIFTEAQIFQVSREREAAGDGCFVRQNRLIVRRDGKERDIMHTSEILLPGKHNIENISAAVMAATLAGISEKAIVSVLQTFKGLRHRLELVGEVRGVKYYDDSFSTTPETAIAAIEAFDAPEILILGGSSKKSDFTELGQLLSTRVNIKAIIGIGEEWERIKAEIKNLPTGGQDPKFQIIEGCQNMQEIVAKAAEIATPGDVVLLSPACASFGMFANYKERGEQFTQEVARLNKNS